MGVNFISDKTKQRWNDVADIVENLPEPPVAPRRRPRTKSKGGGAERPYVEITGVIDAENYLGNVLSDPISANIIKTGVFIVVTGALTNPFEIGYRTFSDFVEDFYFIDGFLLGGTIETEEEEP